MPLILTLRVFTATVINYIYVVKNIEVKDIKC